MKRSGFLWKLSVSTLAESEDSVTCLLENVFGVSTSVYENTITGAVDASVFLDAHPPKSLFEKLIQTIEAMCHAGVNVGAGSVKMEKLKREDWAESWKKHFKPIEIGRRLLIRPSWSKRLPKSGQAVVTLDPGLSFGTGCHPTTAFCLEQIVAAKTERSKPLSILDIGTGSGILAISAAKLGFKKIDAFDFDPQAVRVAKQNARINRVTHKMRVFTADLTQLPAKPEQTFDVVCANLISNLLIDERRRICARVAPEGILILAGILQSEFHVVSSAYKKMGFELRADRIENEWQSGAFARV